ncbi:MAG: monovalent cation/H+ antiporter complex subunit F [Candidatus Saganbacteria bacterium]|nr:monovalent cation/H+ antiporter complex subunit F [Candidatus Saganbacteria bacterium]
MSYIFPILLLICCFMCLYRIYRGPTTVDRIIALDILAILVISFCAFESVFAARRFLMDIALSWAILSFVGMLAFAKYLEGVNFDE